MRHQPLPLGTHHWHSRWLYSKRGNRMHRISEVKWDDEEDMIFGEGISVCGVTSRFYMPGVLDRMYSKRCDRCSDYMRIPRGDGAPYNKDIHEIFDAPTFNCRS